MSDGLGGLGEFGLIRELTRGLRSGEGVSRGIGDDCAIVEIAGASLLLTCDASLEGVHFHRDWGAPEDIGWKAAVSALSDIAAMGGRARFVLVTLALPEDTPLDFVTTLYRGLSEAVTASGAAIVGGDTTASRSGIVLDLSVVGEVVGRPMLRSGARPGDLVAVTGVPGRRGAGLHALLHGIEARMVRDYLHPSPRLAEGQWLQAQPGVRAMIDLSDGMLPDARHIAEASGVGIDLRANQLPVNESLEAFWGNRGRDSGPERLRSGKEYELLVALDATDAGTICASFGEQFGIPLTVVGACYSESRAVLVDGAVPSDAGFEHFRRD